MITIKKYVRAESLEQAYELNQKKSNRILGGMLWMKMSSGTVQNAIDLSDVVSAEISEHEDSFIIGAMASLRSLEIHEGLNRYTKGAVKECLRHIVGVQFRNVATIGGSVYGRFGFSDVLTMLLALDTYVELYQGGYVSLSEYAERPYDRDIIVNVIIKKTPVRTAYQSSRNTKTDFPVLTCAVSFLRGEKRIVIGARPQKAVVIQVPDELLEISEEDPEKLAKALAKQAAEEVQTGSNMRGSAEYRRHLAKVLTRRAVLHILEKEEKEEC